MIVQGHQFGLLFFDGGRSCVEDCVEICEVLDQFGFFVSACGRVDGGMKCFIVGG